MWKHAKKKTDIKTEFLAFLLFYHKEGQIAKKPTNKKLRTQQIKHELIEQPGAVLP